MRTSGNKFEEMRYSNLEESNRLKREPVWAWVGDEEKPDAIQLSKLRILAITWNMHGQKEPENIKDLLP